MELRGFEPLPPACHAVAKSLANTGNYRVYNSILTLLGAALSAELSKHIESNKSIDMTSFYGIY